MHSPKPITKIMTFINNNSLPFTLNLLSANLQHTNHTNLLLALSLDANDLPSLKRMLGIG